MIILLMQVSERERQLAERYYLKHYAAERASVSTTGNGRFSSEHPRYAQLETGMCRNCC